MLPTAALLSVKEYQNELEACLLNRGERQLYMYLLSRKTARLRRSGENQFRGCGMTMHPVPKVLMIWRVLRRLLAGHKKWNDLFHSDAALLPPWQAVPHSRMRPAKKVRKYFEEREMARVEKSEQKEAEKSSSTLKKSSAPTKALPAFWHTCRLRLAGSDRPQSISWGDYCLKTYRGSERIHGIRCAHWSKRDQHEADVCCGRWTSVPSRHSFSCKCAEMRIQKKMRLEENFLNLFNVNPKQKIIVTLLTSLLFSILVHFASLLLSVLSWPLPLLHFFPNKRSCEPLWSRPVLLNHACPFAFRPACPLPLGSSSSSVRAVWCVVRRGVS